MIYLKTTTSRVYERRSLALYQDKRVERIDEWYKGLKADREDLLIVLTERAGEIAMSVIDRDRNTYVNEESREYLLKIWTKNYMENMKLMIPVMAEYMNEAVFSITGITVQKPPKRSKTIGMGQRFLN